ncbi:hypothetical protein BKA62DRAFT_774523 [Auriculariales sp. MPI-PUGE-AT-0066]|nr:hypothetical protein BKA62DRAFT_774523 [Auriculariales sp. MPI-PUGE-AT-0066]
MRSFFAIAFAIVRAVLVHAAPVPVLVDGDRLRYADRPMFGPFPHETQPAHDASGSQFKSGHAQIVSREVIDAVDRSDTAIIIGVTFSLLAVVLVLSLAAVFAFRSNSTPPTSYPARPSIRNSAASSSTTLCAVEVLVEKDVEHHFSDDSKSTKVRKIDLPQIPLSAVLR